MAAEYQRRHNPIWPELEKALKSHGAGNYSIFLHEKTGMLFGYVEIEDEERFSGSPRRTVPAMVALHDRSARLRKRRQPEGQRGRAERSLPPGLKPAVMLPNADICVKVSTRFSTNIHGGTRLEQLIGIVLLSLGGLSAASFYVPSYEVKSGRGRPTGSRWASSPGSSCRRSAG